MEELRLDPLGFVANDYATLVWGLEPVDDPGPLFAALNLRADFETWLSGNAVMKKTFRGAATIAGLIERNLPQTRKTGRQATFSSDILYDTLAKYDPDHLMLQITREEAMRGLVDFGRIEEMLTRTAGKVDHLKLDRVTPLSLPMFLEQGRIAVAGAAQDRMLEEEAARLIAEVGID
ncbi:MAG: DNA ligase-associated DEXH box helicase, partial [Pseudomonadota bacterium]